MAEGVGLLKAGDPHRESGLELYRDEEDVSIRLVTSWTALSN